MKSRIAVVIVCISALMSLYGCSSILEGETGPVITAHQEPAATASDSIIVANTFEELKSDLMKFVRNHDETGMIRVYSYSGDIQEDVDLACSQIVHDDPIGSFAVAKMTGKATKIVSYYEVECHINYKNVTKEQLESIIPVSTTRYLKSDLQDMLAEYAPSMTILTKNIVLTADDALGYVEQMYYENPMDIVMLPVTTVDLYPDHGIDRIIRFTFGYRYEAGTLKVMEKNLKTTVQNIAESAGGDSDGAILLSLCEHLMATVEYDGSTAANNDYSNQNVSATAYGALVTGSAVGEGYAMAYKALCDELGIECYVVLGSLNGKPHAWNIVYLEGNYYHIDVSMCDLNGISTAFLLSDATIKKSYSWDTDKYKPCSGPLTYKSFY